MTFSTAPNKRKSYSAEKSTTVWEQLSRKKSFVNGKHSFPALHQSRFATLYSSTCPWHLVFHILPSFGQWSGRARASRPSLSLSMLCSRLCLAVLRSAVEAAVSMMSVTSFMSFSSSSGCFAWSRRGMFYLQEQCGNKKKKNIKHLDFCQAPAGLCVELPWCVWRPEPTENSAGSVGQWHPCLRAECYIAAQKHSGPLEGCPHLDSLIVPYYTHTNTKRVIGLWYRQTVGLLC